jgi:hypothetical protein
VELLRLLNGWFDYTKFTVALSRKKSVVFDKKIIKKLTRENTNFKVLVV